MTVAGRTGGVLLIGGAIGGAIVGIAMLVGYLSDVLAFTLLAFVAVTWGLGYGRLEAVGIEPLGRQAVRKALRLSTVAWFAAFLALLLIAWTEWVQVEGMYIFTTLPIIILMLVWVCAGVAGVVGFAMALRQHGGRPPTVGETLAIAVVPAKTTVGIAFGDASNMESTLWVALASFSAASLLLRTAA